ncbi:prolyl oligopeptidase family serine peptidase [Escherichia albertii]|uniref:prolyl oligopeptidase family serine peptidase n=1 Tax=Escherichia albertii TaxID=208962 RepID=UPI001A1458F3|nr:prolyl oligopeptidase family serine peptidase [Escherichia albertii]MCU7297290.1 prolyl oligopeptidase family serine peptidase [Escherichia albertii]MCU7306617.1 prolyl oligopeptidase family serine peptidase [Escherichia albertii]MCZ8925598.1 prolyl oligopeptidase family serine peptidase [Escherichia albertii]MCZ9155011.1 prolyl oligopeptidase family serine peptidase [Escherichia albertii]MCZ9164586.1 prolyl oligopeptidase family serine peptidase [Escherichia albertii]
MTALSDSISLAMAGNSASDDEFLWLEELQGQESLQWVQKENQRTMARFTRNQNFLRIEREVLNILNKDTQIPWVSKYGDYYYNFWQDQAHPQGLLRRTTPDEYRKEHPAWETVLDIDALCKTEGREWIFQGLQPLAPEYRHCLLYLSPDGGDASEIREFDLVTRCFVKDGFNVPVAKNQVSWVDQNTLFIATDFGPGSMTRSGYVRIVKRWQRGQPLNIAETLYEAQHEDMEVFAYRDATPGFERDFVGRMTDFWCRDYFLLTQSDQLIKIDIPADAELDTHREWILVRLTSDWEVGGKRYPSGALLAADFDDFLAGKRELQLLFAPSVGSVLSDYSKTRDYLILSIMNNATSRLEVLMPQKSGWLRRPLASPVTMSIISAEAIDEESNDYFLTISGFLQPASLYTGNLDDGEITLLKQAPQDFDVTGYQVSQHFVRSRDGTRVSYFQIAANNLRLDGSTPTLLYGYGGFSESLLPEYLGNEAPTWLERGGVYVVANIRGGGEYGPDWHKAALKQNRHRSFEDFAAVAKDLIARKVTSSHHLGIRGESNGGLLTGNMLTLYPHLFGCIVCGVPLLDMKRYTQLSAGASWIAEFGDPDKPEEWDYIRTFSPYHNIKAEENYPPVLFYTATSDDRVNPAHARKMAARMQAMGHQQVYFYENTKGGHNAAADKQQAAFISALVSEFMWFHLR